MNDYVFEMEMSKLRNVFGDRFYPRERVEEFWNMVRNADDNDFKQFISRCVREAERPPLGQKFSEFAKEADRKKHEQNKIHLVERMRLGQACRTCADEGRMMATEKATGLVFVFNCTYCKVAEQSGPGFKEFGKHNPMQIADWSEAYSNEYHLHRVSDSLFKESDEVIRQERWLASEKERLLVQNNLNRQINWKKGDEGKKEDIYTVTPGDGKKNHKLTAEEDTEDTFF